MQDPKKLVVMLAHNSNDDRSSVAFTIANVALSSGMEVAVFLSSDGVELAREKACDMTAVAPFKKLEELVDGFVEGGGVVWTCAPCFQHRGMNVEETVPGTVVTGAGPLLEWVADGASTICL